MIVEEREHGTMLPTNRAPFDETGAVEESADFLYEGEQFLRFNRVTICHNPASVSEQLTLSVPLRRS